MCFFLYCYGVHRDLHSFPTRRSSDLVHVEALGDLRVVAAEFGAGVPQQFALELVAQVGPELVLAAVRSEEHTSELQSRPHLVCRLLLEKKKKIHTTTHHSYSTTYTSQ